LVSSARRHLEHPGMEPYLHWLNKTTGEWELICGSTTLHEGERTFVAGSVPIAVLNSPHFNPSSGCHSAVNCTGAGGQLVAFYRTAGQPECQTGVAPEVTPKESKSGLQGQTIIAIVMGSLFLLSLMFIAAFVAKRPSPPVHKDSLFHPRRMSDDQLETRSNVSAAFYYPDTSKSGDRASPVQIRTDSPYAERVDAKRFSADNLHNARHDQPTPPLGSPAQAASSRNQVGNTSPRRHSPPRKSRDSSPMLGAGAVFSHHHEHQIPNLSSPPSPPAHARPVTRTYVA